MVKSLGFFEFGQVAFELDTDERGRKNVSRSYSLDKDFVAIQGQGLPLELLFNLIDILTKKSETFFFFCNFLALAALFFKFFHLHATFKSRRRLLPIARPFSLFREAHRLFYLATLCRGRTIGHVQRI